MKLKICTWNVLADSYIRGQKVLQFFDSKSDKLSFSLWRNRKSAIESALRETKADIICLQEVDHYHDFYHTMLKTMKYESFYVQRPGKKDGCLLAYNSEMFECIDQEDVDLDRLSFLDAHERAGRSKFAKQNVAAFILLKDRTLSVHFIVATCHIHWNPNLPEVKFAQTQLILEELSRFRSKISSKTAVILTGDFNSFPHDDVYGLVTGKQSLAKFQYLLSQPGSKVTQKSLNLKFLYGPNTKFLCDFSLAKLCRWMRILGVDVAMDSWEYRGDGPASMTKLSADEKSRSINLFFERARKEKRVILTSSKTLIERSSCPQCFYVQPNHLETALVSVYHEFGLDLSRERFLTVCGKCGGEIEEVDGFDERLMGKIIPNDRQIYACKACAQPYWWNDQENSSPAKAMKKAEELYQIIVRGLRTIDPSLQLEKLEETGETEEDEEEGRSKHQQLQQVIETSFEPTDEESQKMPAGTEDIDLKTLSSMFERRNQIVSSGKLSEPATPAPPLAPPAPAAAQTEISSESAPPTEVSLIEFRSVFGEEVREPGITNWSGEFRGTLDYIFASPAVLVRHAAVYPRLEGNAHLAAVADESEEPRAEIFQQTLTQPQPSAEWPSDHFLLSAVLELP